MYEIIKMPAFFLIGIQIHTSNNNFVEEVPPLWQRVYAENIIDLIPNKVNNDLLAVYSNYVGDYTQPFSYTLGYRVSSLEQVPAGMVALHVPEQEYAVFTATGEYPQSVAAIWYRIWDLEKNELRRAYKTDFEVYGPAFAEPQKEVKIYIGLQK